MRYQLNSRIAVSLAGSRGIHLTVRLLAVGSKLTLSPQKGFASKYIGPYTFSIMQTRLTLKPGQRGTKKLLKRYGDKLVCVRYRYDPHTKKRYKTVELIVEEVEWAVKSPLPGPETMVELRVDWGETAVGVEVKKAGGVWNADKKVWEIAYGQVEQMGLTERIVGVKS